MFTHWLQLFIVVKTRSRFKFNKIAGWVDSFRSYFLNSKFSLKIYARWVITIRTKLFRSWVKITDPKKTVKSNVNFWISTFDKSIAKSRVEIWPLLIIQASSQRVSLSLSHIDSEHRLLKGMLKMSIFDWSRLGADWIICWSIDWRSIIRILEIKSLLIYESWSTIYWVA